jgi:hypothetical protein
MAEGQETAVRPVSRGRRITGIVLIALGAFDWAYMAVLFWVTWAGFDHDGWVRFVTYLWLGPLLVLIGCRLVYRSRAAAWAAVLWVVAGFGMVYVHDHWLR